jgi:hypothetical protein
MSGTLIFNDQLEIPLDLATLQQFRAWAVSPAFPQRGRIDYLNGRIEVDMSPEDLFCHGTLKTELIAAMAPVIKRGNLGHLFSDSTRVSCPQCQLSV